MISLIIPATSKNQNYTDNIIDNYTNISFHNLTVTGTSDISFYSSNNTITSS